MEAVSVAAASVDAGETEHVHESSHELSKEREEDNDDAAAAEKDMESEEAELKETETEVIHSVGSTSPSQAFSAEETEETVTVNDGEPGSTTEPQKEAPEVKCDEGLEVISDEGVESKAEDLAGKDESQEESPAVADVSEDACMDAAPDREEEKEIKNTDENMDTSNDTKEEVCTEQESSICCKPKVLTAGDELDEMMDIGTVDQVEQEAQMKEEEQNSLKDMESSRSPDASNTGIKMLFDWYICRCKIESL